MRSILALLAVAVLASGCATPMLPMPSNVSTVKGDYDAIYIDKVDHSYNAGKKVPVSAIKLCIAENVQNDAVQLVDASKTWIGPATKNIYTAGTNTTIQGGGVYKLVDDSASIVVASGSTKYTGSSMLIPIIDIIRFDLKVVAPSEDVVMTFMNITRAQQDTGYAQNSGFKAIGTWQGARADTALQALENVATKVKNCMK